MLDVTGSMCDPCTKIDAVKSAAKDLIDIVVWDDQSTYTSRVALAPFADAVNVGTTLAPLVRNTTTGSSGSPLDLHHDRHAERHVEPADEELDQVQQRQRQQQRRLHHQRHGQLPLANPLQVRDRARRYARIRRHCAEHGTSNTLVGKGYFSNTATSGCSVANSADPEVNLIMPMTQGQNGAEGPHRQVQTGGSTAGHLGTAWAWYLLSPNWNSVFSGTTSAAGPYSDLTVINSQSSPSCARSRC